MVRSPSIGLVGDLVGSRRAPSRAALQHELVAALARAGRLATAVDPLAPTLGDEFQARYADLPTALTAVLALQLLLGADRVRFGLGVGELAVHDPAATPLRQDGPVWWAARAAIDEVSGGSPRWGARVCWWHEASGSASSGPGRGVAAAVPWANALLALRDRHVGGLRERDRRIALGLLEGEQQAAIATSEGVSASAVSQRVRAAGLRALCAQVAALEVPAP